MNRAAYTFFQSIKKVANRWGIDISSTSKTAPFDLSAHCDLHPCAASYQAGLKAALVRVSVERCIHMNYLASPCRLETTSPFILTLSDFHNGTVQQYNGSRLESFYKCFRPTNAAELMGLPAGSFPKLEEMPALAAPFFWLNEAAQQYSDFIRSRILLNRVENRHHGLNDRDGLDDNHLFGGVSIKKGELEFRRLVQVYKSIMENGLRYSVQGLDNINAVWLMIGDDWKVFLPRSGQHRVAAATVLGLSSIVVEIRPEATGGIIRREDIGRWPLVSSGVIAQSTATALFDRIFTAQPPESAADWLKSINAGEGS